MVPNIPVFDQVSRNWFLSFLETKKLGSPPKTSYWFPNYKMPLLLLRYLLGFATESHQTPPGRDPTRLPHDLSPSPDVEPPTPKPTNDSSTHRHRSLPSPSRSVAMEPRQRKRMGMIVTFNEKKLETGFQTTTLFFLETNF
jgi:hypothetical protein